MMQTIKTPSSLVGRFAGVFGCDGDSGCAVDGTDVLENYV